MMPVRSQLFSASPNGKKNIRPRVLIVDDDIEITNLLHLVLDPNEFEVSSCHTGREAVELAKKLQPDVMIVDMYLPEMDGLAVTRAVRSFSNLPILILSVIDKPAVIEQALREGADDFMTKPVNQTLLVAHLKNLARRHRAERAALVANLKGSI